MEAFRRRRSHSARSSSPAKVTTIIDRSSSEKFSIPADKTHRDLQQIGKQQNSRISSFGSSPCQSSITTEEDLHSLELGQSSSGQHSGTLMKKLLADEMSKESEPRRRSPSLVARLMGLDVPPLQHISSKEKKGSGECYQHKSCGLHKDKKSQSSHSRSKISKEQQLFKDVFEVSKGVKNHSPKQKHGDDEMAYVRQKFTDAKRLSAKEQLHDSWEFDGTLEELESNRDILVKLLDDPDSLFAKHLQDLQVAHPSHCGHLRGVKSANAYKHNIQAIGRHSGHEASRKIDISFSQRQRNLAASQKSSRFKEDAKVEINAPSTKIVILKPNVAKVNDSAKFVSSPSALHDLLSDREKNKEYLSSRHVESSLARKELASESDRSSHKSRESREIAVEITQQMRSKLGDASFNASTCGYKGYSANEIPHDMSGNECRESKELAKVVTQQVRSKLGGGSFNASISGCNGYSADESSHEMSGNECRQPREFAKQVTDQMKNKLGDGPFNYASLYGYSGCSADESSHDMSGNESSFDTATTTLTRQTPRRSSCQRKPSASLHTDSHVNMEAKKRLSERWRMSHSSQEVVMVGKGSTLGEMLAVPDVDIRHGTLDTPCDRNDSFDGFDQNVLIPGWVAPLGISSKDGWKDGSVGTMSRSKSLPSSARSVGSPKTGVRIEPLGNERSMARREGKGCRRNRAMKNLSDQKEESLIGSSSSNQMRLHIPEHLDKEIVYDVPDIRFSQSQESTPEVKDFSELKTVISENKTDTVDTGKTIDVAVDVEHGGSLDALNHHPEQGLLPEVNADVVVEDKYSATNFSESKNPLEHWTRHASEVPVSSEGPINHPESLSSDKVSSQPSPDSVLEPETPFVEDLSSGSECFERVSAELHGLRMQLKLLRQESDSSYDEDVMHISSDEGAEEVSFTFPSMESSYLSQEEGSWASSYLSDVITEARFLFSGPEKFMESWDSAECPIGSWVFDNIEKKYTDDEICQRSDRKLFFDRINAAIWDVCQEFADPCPWVRLPMKVAVPQWSKDGVIGKVVDMLASQDERMACLMLEDVEEMFHEMRWMNTRDQVDVIGGEIEKMMIDDLVEEITAM